MQRTSILNACPARFRRLLRRAKIRLTYRSLDQGQILNALGSLHLLPSGFLMVHSSLSSCGHIKGGAITVINALRHWVGLRNLVLPTHTYCYPGLNGEVPICDPNITPSVVGSITDAFWRLPGVVRSTHPTHSLAVSGPDAEAICEGHELCDTPCGKGTPYERLIESDSAVLMFGATMNTYTFFHTAEDAAGVPYLYEPEPYELFVKGADVARVSVRMWRQDMKVPRQFGNMDSWLENRGALARSRLGMGELLFIPSSKRVHDLVIEEMRRNPYFLVAPDAQVVVAKRFQKTCND